jgi:hypothetical protein
VNWASQNVSGANLPRIGPDRLLQYEFQLPEVAEQKRIAAMLERANRLRRMRRYGLELSDNLLSVAYVRLFGDPQTNPNNVPIEELGEYIAFLTSGSRGWAEHYVKSGARFIRSLDVQMNRIPNDNAVFVDAPPGAEAERTLIGLKLAICDIHGFLLPVSDGLLALTRLSDVGIPFGQSIAPVQLLARHAFVVRGPLGQQWREACRKTRHLAVGRSTLDRCRET